jgi:hypothetical protein
VWAQQGQVTMRQTDDMEELRRRLHSMRVTIAKLKNSALDDLDALLSVAEAELERALEHARPE